MLAVLDWSGHRHVHELQRLPMHCSQLGYREQQLFQVRFIQLHLLQAGQLRPWSSTGSVTTAAVTTAAIAKPAHGVHRIHGIHGFHVSHYDMLWVDRPNLPKLRLLRSPDFP